MQQFQLVDYIPWLGSVLAEVLVVTIMLKQHLLRRFPIFFVSVAYDLARQAALVVFAVEGPRAYGIARWVTLPVEYVIAFGVMLEAFRYSLGADPKIPAKILRSMVVIAVLLVALAAFLVLHPDVPASNLRGLILALDRSIGLLRCWMLLLMWAFARKLGISWRHHVWGIVFGLGIYSGISLIVVAVHATTGDLCGGWLARLIPFSYFAATIIWAVFLWRPEPQRGAVTLDHLALIGDLIAAYRRIVAELWRSSPDDGA